MTTLMTKYPSFYAVVLILFATFALVDWLIGNEQNGELQRFLNHYLFSFCLMITSWFTAVFYLVQHLWMSRRWTCPWRTEAEVSPPEFPSAFSGPPVSCGGFCAGEVPGAVGNRGPCGAFPGSRPAWSSSSACTDVHVPSWGSCRGLCVERPQNHHRKHGQDCAMSHLLHLFSHARRRTGACMTAYKNRRSPWFGQLLSVSCIPRCVPGKGRAG